MADAGPYITAMTDDQFDHLLLGLKSQEDRDWLRSVWPASRTMAHIIIPNGDTPGQTDSEVVNKSTTKLRVVYRVPETFMACGKGFARLFIKSDYATKRWLVSYFTNMYLWDERKFNFLMVIPEGIKRIDQDTDEITEHLRDFFEMTLLWIYESDHLTWQDKSRKMFPFLRKYTNLYEQRDPPDYSDIERWLDDYSHIKGWLVDFYKRQLDENDVELYANIITNGLPKLHIDFLQIRYIKTITSPKSTLMRYLYNQTLGEFLSRAPYCKKILIEALKAMSDRPEGYSLIQSQSDLQVALSILPSHSDKSRLLFDLIESGLNFRLESYNRSDLIRELKNHEYLQWFCAVDRGEATSIIDLAGLRLNYLNLCGLSFERALRIAFYFNHCFDMLAKVQASTSGSIPEAYTSLNDALNELLNCSLGQGGTQRKNLSYDRQTSLPTLPLEIVYRIISYAFCSTGLTQKEAIICAQIAYQQEQERPEKEVNKSIVELTSEIKALKAVSANQASLTSFIEKAYHLFMFVFDPQRASFCGVDTRIRFDTQSYAEVLIRCSSVMKALVTRKKFKSLPRTSEGDAFYDAVFLIEHEETSSLESKNLEIWQKFMSAWFDREPKDKTEVALLVLRDLIKLAAHDCPIASKVRAFYPSHLEKILNVPEASLAEMFKPGKKLIDCFEYLPRGHEKRFHAAIWLAHACQIDLPVSIVKLITTRKYSNDQIVQEINSVRSFLFHQDDQLHKHPLIGWIHDRAIQNAPLALIEANPSHTLAIVLGCFIRRVIILDQKEYLPVVYTLIANMRDIQWLETRATLGQYAFSADGTLVKNGGPHERNVCVLWDQWFTQEASKFLVTWQEGDLFYDGLGIIFFLQDELAKQWRRSFCTQQGDINLYWLKEDINALYRTSRQACRIAMEATALPHSLADHLEIPERLNKFRDTCLRGGLNDRYNEIVRDCYRTSPDKTFNVLVNDFIERQYRAGYSHHKEYSSFTLTSLAALISFMDLSHEQLRARYPSVKNFSFFDLRGLFESSDCSNRCYFASLGLPAFVLPHHRGEVSDSITSHAKSWDPENPIKERDFDSTQVPSYYHSMLSSLESAREKSKELYRLALGQGHDKDSEVVTNYAVDVFCLEFIIYQMKQPVNKDTMGDVKSTLVDTIKLVGPEYNRDRRLSGSTINEAIKPLLDWLEIDRLGNPNPIDKQFSLRKAVAYGGLAAGATVLALVLTNTSVFSALMTLFGVISAVAATASLFGLIALVGGILLSYIIQGIDDANFGVPFCVKSRTIHQIDREIANPPVIQMSELREPSALEEVDESNVIVSQNNA